MPDWLSSAPAVASAAALVMLPGLAVASSLRLRGLTALALAGPLSVSLFGVSGVLFSLLGIRFDWWAPVLLAAIAVAGVLILRIAIGRRASAPLGGIDRYSRGTAIAVGAVLISAVIISIAAFGAVASPDLISQTYDAVFHLNAAAAIQQNGDASSFNLYAINHTKENSEFYPAAWHSLVAAVSSLTGSGIPIATNAAWIAVAATVWPLGCAWLAVVLFGERYSAVLLATSAALLSSAFAAFPYLLLDWGTLYPTFVAYCILPVGLGLLALALPWSSARSVGSWRPWAIRAPWRVWLLLAAWLLAAAFAHPRSIISWVLIGTPLVLTWIVSGLWRMSRDPLRRRFALTIAGALGGIILVGSISATLLVFRYYNVSERPIADHLNGGPATATQDSWQSLLQALGSAPIVTPSKEALPVPLLLAAVVLVAVVITLFTPGLRWLGVAYLLVVLLYCLAAGTNSDFAKVATGLWYKDKYRLMAILPILAVPMTAALGAAALAAAQRWRSSVAVRVVAALIGATVLASAWFGSTLAGMQGSIGQVFRDPDSEKDGALLDKDQLLLLERLPEEVPADAVIAGNPWNGSGMSWAIGSRESLFPHVAGVWDHDRRVVAKRLDKIESNPAVCAALDALGVEWVLADSEVFGNGDPSAELFRGIDRAVASGVLTEVDREGSAALYRIDEC